MDEAPVANTAVATAQRTSPVRRGVVLTIGMGVLMLGVAMSISAGIGTGSWQVLELGLMHTLGWPFGPVAIVESLVLIVVAWAWLRQAPGIATFVLALGGGPTVQWLLTVVPEPTTFVTQLIMVTASAVVMGIGVALYVAADFGASAQDALFVGLYRSYPIRPGVAKLLLDVTVLATGWLLGGPVGIGTIAVSVVTPWVVDVLLPVGHRVSGTEPRGLQVAADTSA